MSPIDTLRSKLIDKILVTENEQLLEAIDSIFSSTSDSDIYKLNSYEIELLKMSEEDIKAGRIMSHEELAKRDSEWMS
ncbi:MAG: hypothetical protein O3B35_05570 [Proteobacteria bacterium]|nr:hypothetical protein [Bacteroidota bacterium]MDA0900480.1 hypothetical protein [Pseudomonadota bacterium]MDA1126888.1 hypothetical protein [Bacteroidota bacterium]